MSTPTITLADKNKLNPATVLIRISKYAKVGAEGGVSYTGWDYHEDMSLLHAMFKFDHRISQEAARTSINRAVGVCIRDKRLTTDYFLATVKKLYAKEVGSVRKQYRFLSELSLDSSILIGSYTVGEAKVRIFRGAFPSKFASRKIHADDYRRQNTDQYPPSYQKVVVDIEERTAELGFQAGMDAIDVVRALISMDANLAMEMHLGGERSIPINKVMPGGLHTLHRPDGASAYDGFWYEPLARFLAPHKINQNREMQIVKKLRRFLGILNKAKDREFSEHLMRSLTQYVRAFDEPDPSNCLLKGWRALEQLVGEDAPGDGEKIVKRISFLYADNDEIQLTLNVIKHARNDIAHRGSGRQHLRTHCYWIQAFFVQTFAKYLGALRQGKSKKEYDQFLELPQGAIEMKAELSSIEERKALLRSGLKFRSPQ